MKCRPGELNVRCTDLIVYLPLGGSVRWVFRGLKRGNRSRRWVTGSLIVALVVVASVMGIRIRAATMRAREFVAAVNAHEFVRTGELLEPQDQPLPNPWAHPRHWGDAGALDAHADLAPLQAVQVVRGVRYVVAMVELDALSRRGTRLFLHEFRVTATSLTRAAKEKPDSAEYPVTIRPVLTEEPLETPPDLVDVPVLDLRMGTGPA